MESNISYYPLPDKRYELCIEEIILELNDEITAVIKAVKVSVVFNGEHTPAPLGTMVVHRDLFGKWVFDDLGSEILSNSYRHLMQTAGRDYLRDKNEMMQNILFDAFDVNTSIDVTVPFPYGCDVNVEVDGFNNVQVCFVDSVDCGVLGPCVYCFNRHYCETPMVVTTPTMTLADAAKLISVQPIDRLSTPDGLKALIDELFHDVDVFIE